MFLSKSLIIIFQVNIIFPCISKCKESKMNLKNILIPYSASQMFIVRKKKNLELCFDFMSLIYVEYILQKLSSISGLPSQHLAVT